MKSKMLLMLLSLFAVGIFSGCEKKGPAEKAGEQLDNGVDKVQQKANDVGEDVKDAGKDVKESVAE